MEAEERRKNIVGTAERVGITTTSGLEGYRTIRYLGIAWGSYQPPIEERIAKIGAQRMMDSVRAGVDLSSSAPPSSFNVLKARQKAVDEMRRHAVTVGANAIVGMRFDRLGGADIGDFEIVAYGTAVVIEQTAIAKNAARNSVETDSGNS